MPLDEAFRRLEMSEDKVAEFRSEGMHMSELRRQWRTLVLANHPDKVAHLELGGEETERRAAAFSSAMAAFEAVDAFYSQHFIEHDTPLKTA